jgi:hypothetical protein
VRRLYRCRVVRVWCGSYAFKREDPFFKKVVTAARRYTGKQSAGRFSEDEFRAAMEELRGIAPEEGVVLLDQLEHRWTHPDCPPALYVLTCALLAPEGGFVVDGDGRRKEKLLCTKVGEAKRTVAGRIEQYTRDVLGGLWPEDGSHTMRVVIYGDGDTMLLESQVRTVAELNGSRVTAIEADGTVRSVGDETYASVQIIDAICTFAQEHASV